MRGIFAFVLSLAACCVPASASDWYASIYGGANWNSVIDVPFVDSQDGHVIGGTVGRKVASIPGLRVEADISYRTNDVEILAFLTAKHETTGVMANLVYDIGGGPVRPYVLVGGGYAHTEATFESISLLKLESGDIAYQLGGGVQFEVVTGARIGVGYRFFQGPEVEVLGLELSDGENHSAIGSLSFDL
jgi:opacity protein-like surface antigen